MSRYGFRNSTIAIIIHDAVLFVLNVFNDKENIEMKNIGAIETEKIPLAVTKL